MERRLAAVLIADVVGYGRLSQVDEEGTRARFQADLREVFEPRLATHRGRLVKTMGDGLLVEFQSVVDALRFAVDVQQEKQKRNESAAPGEKLDFRIGINLGDVIVEGDDIHGDGVNIADRMQTLAEPGGVAISGTAYDHVKAKLPVGYASLGEQTVKSIAEPIRVYRVLLDPSAAGKTQTQPTRRAWHFSAAAGVAILVLAAAILFWLQPWGRSSDSATEGSAAAATGPSLVVLPFDNLSDDSEQGYLADGITEDLTTELARVPNLFVVSRSAAFTYRDTALSPGEIASELGVKYLLEGSVRRIGDDIRINAQLIDAGSGGHVWAERYDGAWSDVFELQEKVLSEVSTALRVRLVADPQQGGAGGTANPTAYEAYLKGLQHLRRDTPEDIASAASLFERAVELDPNFGRAWADLAFTYWNAWDVSEKEAALGLSRNEMLPKMYSYLEEAAKRPSSAYYAVLGSVLTQERNLEAALSAIEKAIALDPSDHYSYHEMSRALVFEGRASEALEKLAAAARLDPAVTDWRRHLLGIAYFGMDRFEDAVAELGAIKPDSTDYWAFWASRYFLTSAYAHLGRLGEATTLKDEIEAEIAARGETTSTVLLAQSYFPFQKDVDRDRLLSGLRKAGMTELPFGFSSRIADKLSGEQVRSLVFGHELEGRNDAGGMYGRITSVDGATQVRLGTGPWSSGVSSVIEGDALCAWARSSGGSCGVVLKNPEGSFENRNEYLFVRAYDHREFSVIK